VGEVSLQTIQASELSMRAIRGWSVWLSFLVVGYLLGSLQFGLLSTLRAQPQIDTFPDAVKGRVREVNRAISDVMQVLVEQKRYVPAVQGINAFATSVGGVDAVADLESGQGVDPETFAGLYAGEATPDVAHLLSRDEQGHLTYNKKVVRLYSRNRLKECFARRAQLMAGAAAAAKSTPKPSPAPKKENDAEKTE
jgi:hypothetical protein